jgi:hypothetical protein
MDMVVVQVVVELVVLAFTRLCITSEEMEALEFQVLLREVRHIMVVVVVVD